MTGDIPPALLVDYICTRLDVPFKEPKQQRWQRAKVFTDDLGGIKAVWLGAWDSKPPASTHKCQITDAQGKSRTFEYAQSENGTIYWAEWPLA